MFIIPVRIRARSPLFIFTGGGIGRGKLEGKGRAGQIKVVGIHAKHEIKIIKYSIEYKKGKKNENKTKQKKIK